MMIVMRTIVILHECGVTVVEINHTMREEILLVMEVNLLRGDTCTILALVEV